MLADLQQRVKREHRTLCQEQLQLCDLLEREAILEAQLREIRREREQLCNTIRYREVTIEKLCERIPLTPRKSRGFKGIFSTDVSDDSEAAGSGSTQSSASSVEMCCKFNGHHPQQLVQASQESSESIRYLTQQSV